MIIILVLILEDEQMDYFIQLQNQNQNVFSLNHVKNHFFHFYHFQSSYYKVIKQYQENLISKYQKNYYSILQIVQEQIQNFKLIQNQKNLIQFLKFMRNRHFIHQKDLQVSQKIIQIIMSMKYTLIVNVDNYLDSSLQPLLSQANNRDNDVSQYFLQPNILIGPVSQRDCILY
ncbi:unnamed protein product [Paramecium sonneborni]|uniref:Uncharacterized protein n=1 Tax=Paramecium sonneborni TaxID=65129 RepID=A0A8S1P3Q5_9CILI|nr:unnamed protein product [Paramecium sonneborni]